MDWTIWLAFLVASVAISLSPGAAAVAAMSAGLNHGFARGRRIVYGLILGLATQVAVVALGVGALVAASAAAFAAVKWAGVGYLVYLGWCQWRAPAPASPGQARPQRQADGRGLVLRGWIVNALNPKGTLFLLAVVPQFLDLQRALAPQYAVIGATLMSTELVVMCGYALLAARLQPWLAQPRPLLAVNRVFGALYMAAGAALAALRRTA